MTTTRQSTQGETMLNAILALIGVIVDILVAAAKKLVGLAVFATLFTVTIVVTTILILDYLVR